MDIFLNQLIQFYLNNTKSEPLNSTHYAVLYPQNGHRIVTIDYVTSLHPMYTNRAMVLSMRALSTRQSLSQRRLLLVER